MAELVESLSDRLLYLDPRLFHFCMIHAPAVDPDDCLIRQHHRREIEIAQFFIIRHIYYNTGSPALLPISAGSPHGHP